VRLIDVETGLIVAAAEGQTPRELPDDPPDPVSASAGMPFVPEPRLTVSPPDDLLIEPPDDLLLEPPLLASQGEEDLHDAPNDDCDEAAQRSDEYEAAVIDLKARYWALRLKQGVANTSLKSNPGSEISDPELRSRFYGAMREWYARDNVPDLTMMEKTAYLEMDQKAVALRRQCGL
jgi:hypothetical protein